jgi:hypothetical protein
MTNSFVLKKETDLKFGLEQEDYIKKDLEKHFKCCLIKSNKYDRYDYYNDDFYLEIKSRIDINSTTFSNTYLCKNKIDFVKTKNNNKPYYFVVNFNDKLMVIEIDDRVCSLKYKTIYLKERNEYTNVVEIPVEWFKLVKNKSLDFLFNSLQ